MRVYMPRHTHTLDLAIPRRNYQKQRWRNLRDALRVPPTFQAPPSHSHAYPHAPHRRASPQSATYTRASRYHQTNPSAAPATRPPTPTPHTPHCRQPGLVPRTATRPPTAPFPAAARRPPSGHCRHALFNPDALTMLLLGRLSPPTHPGALVHPIPGNTGGASVTHSV